LHVSAAIGYVRRAKESGGRFARSSTGARLELRDARGKMTSSNGVIRAHAA